MNEDNHIHNNSTDQHRVLRKRGKGLRGFLFSFVITFAVLYFLVFVPIPYYIYKPGTAESVKPMVYVAEPDLEEQGAFMLTTVSLNPRTNVLNYLFAHWDPNADVQRKKDVLNGQSEQQFMQRQEIVMLESQSSAIQAAYKKANIPYEVKDIGAYITDVREDMPAATILRPGDIVVSIDGAPATGIKDIQAALTNKKVGDIVEIGIRRGTEEQTFQLQLSDIAQGGTIPTASPADSGQNTSTGATSKPGIGITTAELRSIVPQAEGKKVQIQAGEIGGPSAGLIFALEIFNQLTPGDLSKGYRIAGTGTIDAAGNVCSIGGIGHKIVASDREGIDIFFAPKDRIAGECGLPVPVANASDAQKKANQIKSEMKVISVGTLAEALNYLEGLPQKAS